MAAELTGLLDGANYTPVTMAELEDALANESLIRMRLKVDLDDYDELLIYRRGSQQDTVEIPKWKGLRSEERTFTGRQTGGGIHASEAPKAGSMSTRSTRPSEIWYPATCRSGSSRTYRGPTSRCCCPPPRWGSG